MMQKQRVQILDQIDVKGTLQKITLNWVGKCKFTDKPLYTYKLEVLRDGKTEPMVLTSITKTLLTYKVGDPIAARVIVKNGKERYLDVKYFMLYKAN